MHEINIKNLNENAVKLFSENWALLTLKDNEKCNPMTVSWGALGEIWGKDAATVYVRQSRYTKHLIDKENYFSLCFFDNKYRNILSFCGSNSGRDVDKVKETHLTPIYSEAAPYFSEAKIVIICKKMASIFLDKEIFDEQKILDTVYSDNDMHTAYFGEIQKVLISD